MRQANIDDYFEAVFNEAEDPSPILDQNTDDMIQNEEQPQLLPYPSGQDVVQDTSDVVDTNPDQEVTLTAGHDVSRTSGKNIVDKNDTNQEEKLSSAEDATSNGETNSDKVATRLEYPGVSRTQDKNMLKADDQGDANRDEEATRFKPIADPRPIR